VRHGPALPFYDKPVKLIRASVENSDWGSAVIAQLAGAARLQQWPSTAHRQWPVPRPSREQTRTIGTEDHRATIDASATNGREGRQAVGFGSIFFTVDLPVIAGSPTGFHFQRSKEVQECPVI
jgi:hypothetical protein